MSPRTDPFPIEPAAGPLDATVRVPGSKSITNRALVCAALAAGSSQLTGALFADDTAAMVGVLDTLGIAVTAHREADRIEVDGCAGVVPAAEGLLDVRQSGTTARFVLPMLLAGSGRYEVDAHPQMQARPMAATFDALGELGARITHDRAGHLPATVTVSATAAAQGARVRVPGDVSSQFLSGLLLVAPCLRGGLTVELTTDLVSRPYVELTLAVMTAFGAEVAQPDSRTYRVAPTGYRGTTYAVEPDASAASYPWAAAAICGGSVRVEGLHEGSLQGDTAFVGVLEAMGASISRDHVGTTVAAERGSLRGGRFDFTHLSDTAQTLAVVAPFVRGSTTITGIGFIRRKEIDRLEAVATELRRCHIAVEIDPDGWTIHPGLPHPAVIETSEDHRMAMSFALVGLAAGGIEIADPGCVAKTFPGYWDLLDELRRSSTDR